MRKALLISGIAIFLIIFGAGIFFWGDEHAAKSMSIKTVDPAQLANAMQGDHFYSDYRENTLLVNGQVASISGNVITFNTQTTYQAQCQMADNQPQQSTGDHVRVISEGATAVRLPNGVMLKDCVLF